MLGNILRKLPHFKGKYRLAKILLANTINNQKDILVEADYGLAFKLPNLKENIGFNIYVDGAYEKDHVNFIIGKLPPNAVLLDLGANIGSICIPVARRRPDVTILAVEASPRVFSYLKYNVENNKCRNIIIENYALSGRDGEPVAFYSPEDKFGKGSMSAVYTTNKEEVTSVTVDTLIDKHKIAKVDFIKIDVEGYESLVFQGSERLLSRQDAPAILFEFAGWAEEQAMNAKPGDAQRFLLRKEFQLFDLADTNKPVYQKEVLNSGSAMIFAVKKSIA